MKMLYLSNVKQRTDGARYNFGYRERKPAIIKPDKRKRPKYPHATYFTLRKGLP